MTIRTYAIQQISQRLGRVAFEARRARKETAADPVHDLRVAIRRFLQSLRVFTSMLPGRESRKIRKELRPVMKLAGEVRNLDITRELVLSSRVSDARQVAESLAEERGEAARKLTDALRQLTESDFTTHWRQRLQLDL